jgi:hypothetical protein
MHVTETGLPIYKEVRPGSLCSQLGAIIQLLMMLWHPGVVLVELHRSSLAINLKLVLSSTHERLGSLPVGSKHISIIVPRHYVSLRYR